ncbi:Ti-type conjugative transfer relaxase TraA [Caulobacter sp. D4A]|uniref:Ti-type conjugative transfer relaxase TraA n=1 Tax=unclassified Caulobacter TaxID=2648921 RepID=UPI000D739B32|nr:MULTISPECIES: Ti-type conjugative transfer relaxase TraA [unclassified Caulobacter]PXA77564.1 Ti-type conjugative transfer relaxase TraA [Caulobacter sp. D4A]PXA96168.1 Ti-type conjugative transfer relaxase TraA [Caulobacter sp. D5]
MAIYHFSVKVISRASGASAVASAAYRSASRLHDERLDRDHDFTGKSGVVHSEVMLPDGAPEQLSDQATLWNTVEAGEKRKDAQLSREVEFAIPREMDQVQGIALARDFVQREMVDRGMVADLNVHWDIGPDGLAKPHAHVMLSMREVGEEGFGAKVRDWNRTELVEHWREAWADHVNERLASLDIDARIDHRSLEDQGIELEPQNKIGPAAGRMAGEGLEAERLEDHRRIARENGDKIIADPRIALDAITHQQATFTRQDLAKFIHRHSDGKEQFDRAMSAVQASPEMVALGQDGHGQDRFTSREMLAVEDRLHRASELMAQRGAHEVSQLQQRRALAQAGERGLVLSGEQRAAFEHVTEGRDLGVIVGYAGTGKSALLGVAREAWEDAGYRVQGLALSGIAAENLEGGSGIVSRTIASLEHQWKQDRELLDARDVLVIDEAGMIGSRQMERLLSTAEKAGAKVVLVGDPEQLQAIEAGAAFRSIAERHSHVEITQVRRQHEDWQRDATRHLATGRTGEALAAYEARGMVHAAQTRDQAREDLVERWDRHRVAEPDKSRIILTHTNDEVRDLNLTARERLRQAGALGEDVTVKAERGERAFATGDRLMFLKNDRGLGVKNGMLGEIEQVSPTQMSVRLDVGRSVVFDLKDYAQVDHGYAATIHKSQGVTVDRAHVLATPGLDRHGAYVALSRHRDSVQIHYGRDEFEDLGKLTRVLSRERAKDMASDFAERRDIHVPASVRPKAPPQRERGMFAGFKPASPVREPAAAARGVGQFDQHRAIERHARAAVDVMRMDERGLPVLAHQRRALEEARQALGKISPHAAKDLERAYVRDPAMAGETAAGRTQRAIRVLQLEAEVRADPRLRADRFVERWQGLERQRTALHRVGDMSGAGQVKARLGDMAKSLQRDPQVESLLRGRRAELGLPPEMGRSVRQGLIECLGIGRGRGLGI